MLDACGHAPHRDQKERTLAAVSAFLTPLVISARPTR
jgi:hypothetical protein